MESPLKTRSLLLVHHVLPREGGKSAQGLANVACRHLYIVLLYSNCSRVAWPPPSCHITEPQKYVRLKVAQNSFQHLDFGGML